VQPLKKFSAFYGTQRGLRNVIVCKNHGTYLLIKAAKSLIQHARKICVNA
jgi:hypothetical protein